MDNLILFKINDIEVDKTLFAFYVNSAKLNSKKGIEDIENDAKRELIKRALLLSCAKKDGIKVLENELEERLKKITNGKDAFHIKKMASETPLGFRRYIETVVEDIMVEKYLAKNFFIDSYLVDESDVLDFYQKNREFFDNFQAVKAAHIMLKLPDGAPEEQEKYLYDELVRIKHLEGSFEEKAVKFSQCETALDGGYLGVIKKGSLHADLEKVLFMLEENEVSNVIRTDDGLHIVKCIEKLLGVDAVKEDIQEHIKNLKMMEDIDAFIHEKLKEAKIENF